MLMISIFADNSITATKTTAKVLVDGIEKNFDAYNINGSNYFKLRDIAFVLSGTSYQFDVIWDGNKNAINLISGKPYTVVGGEIKSAEGQATITATANNLDAYKYLEYIFRKLPNLRFTADDPILDEYLPWSEKMQLECRIQNTETDESKKEEPCGESA